MAVELTSDVVSVTQLEAFAESVLASTGLRQDCAKTIATYLVDANLRGVDGHGALRLPQYVASIRRGDINLDPDVQVIRQSGATALVDADGGYGFAPSRLAMQVAVSLADTWGVAAVGVTNSHHFGMATFYALQAAADGFVGIAISNTMAVMPAPGGLKPVVGNDPIAIAVPRSGGAVICVDLALSEASWGKISLAAARGEPIPQGWALDSDGRETTVAAEALAANLLVPIGGHKGYALALMFELLAGALTGSPVGPGADGHSHRGGGCGHLLIALNPDRFGGRAAFLERVEELATAVSQSPRRTGQALRLPGERSARLRTQRLVSGIPVPKDIREKLNALADDLGVAKL